MQGYWCLVHRCAMWKLYRFVKFFIAFFFLKKKESPKLNKLIMFFFEHTSPYKQFPGQTNLRCTEHREKGSPKSTRPRANGSPCISSIATKVQLPGISVFHQSMSIIIELCRAQGTSVLCSTPDQTGREFLSSSEALLRWHGWQLSSGFCHHDSLSYGCHSRAEEDTFAGRSN